MKNTIQISDSKKIIAFTDSVNECDCCGKKGLKGTFAVEIDGDEFYYGSTCAFKKHGFSKSESKEALYNFDKLKIARSFGHSTIEEYEASKANTLDLIEDWANQ